MKAIHVPRINPRYWLGITLASVFGTNLGDLYAHELGLGLWLGLAILAAIVAVAFVLERRDRTPHEAWYWLVILIIRTGATNIADFLAFRVRIPPVALAVGLILLLAALAWRTHRHAAGRSDADRQLPDTGTLYWMAMLTAGVLGTVLGDDASHLVGQGVASLGLGAVLLVTLAAIRARTASVAVYWAVIAIARTAGTSIGDWLAENPVLNLHLPLATLISGATFVAVLLVWRAAPAADHES